MPGHTEFGSPARGGGGRNRWKRHPNGAAVLELWLVISALGICWVDPGGNAAPVWRFAGRDGAAPTGGFAALPDFAAGAPAAIEMRGAASRPKAAPPSGTCCTEATYFCKSTQNRESAPTRIVNPKPGQGAKTDASAFVLRRFCCLGRPVRGHRTVGGPSGPPRFSGSTQAPTFRGSRSRIRAWPSFPVHGCRRDGIVPPAGRSPPPRGATPFYMGVADRSYRGDSDGRRRGHRESRHLLARPSGGPGVQIGGDAGGEPPTTSKWLLCLRFAGYFH